MLLFDWKKIYEKTDGKVFDICLVLKMLTYNEVPQNKYDKIYKYHGSDYAGDSFILHPEVLIYNRYKYSYKEIAQYLGLASLRSLAEYKTSGKTTLDLFPIDADLDILNKNRLLNIIDGEVHFIYEEVPKENLH
jgi:hypothetical protein